MTLDKYLTIAECLPQEPKSDVLDKIRAEIKALTDGAEPERIWNVDVLAIIDKYAAEVEPQESEVHDDV